MSEPTKQEIKDVNLNYKLPKYNPKYYANRYFPQYHGLSKVGENLYNYHKRGNKKYIKTQRNQYKHDDHNYILYQNSEPTQMSQEQINKKKEKLEREKGRLFGSKEELEDTTPKTARAIEMLREERLRIFGGC